MDNRSDYPAEPRNLGCELFRVFSQPERNGFATGTLISPSQARRNSSRAWRVGRTEDSPDERELGRRSASRGNGRPKGQPFAGGTPQRGERAPALALLGATDRSRVRDRGLR